MYLNMTFIYSYKQQILQSIRKSELCGIKIYNKLPFKIECVSAK